MTKLTASDGHVLSAYLAVPDAAPRGGLIVGQELFGVNQHIRNVCDGFAAEGYRVLAPCFYDRVQPGGFAVGYSQADLEAARQVLPKLKLETMLLDCQAALHALSAVGRVGMVGYCSGGSVAWYTATQSADLACAVSYYGGWIPRLLDAPPKCPVMLHWGGQDHTIALSEVQKVEAAFPDIPSFVYPQAPHGFNCDLRAAYEPESAALARTRTLDLLHRCVG